jgi:acyl-CoA thioesterase YciA
MAAPEVNVPTAPRGEISLRVSARPAEINVNGHIFGGWVMAQMDSAGGVHARNQVKGPVATVAVDAMRFHKPIEVGDLVTCYTRIVRIGHTSITISVETWAARDSGMAQVHVTSGNFVFVALDADGRPTEITNKVF